MGVNRDIDSQGLGNIRNELPPVQSAADIGLQHVVPLLGAGGETPVDELGGETVIRGTPRWRRQQTIPTQDTPSQRNAPVYPPATDPQRGTEAKKGKRN